MPEPLPIDAVLPDLLAALTRHGQAVLQAPPGAGKTTRVPLALLDAGTPGRIVMLEPRRLAARAAAERMAQTLNEPVGQTVGYRMRGESRVSPQTRIEVLTEGILTRMIQDAPDLPGVSALIFDEFHERSLAADLGLALSLESRAALRPDLRLLVMSATLDAQPVADLMGAPVVTAEGRAYPVDLRWLPRPLGDTRIETATASAIREALAETDGDVLAFLPGEGEIRRTESLLANLDDVAVRPLYSALPASAQRLALEPAETRKVVLATSIAETSLTIPGIRAVVDAGRARRSRFDSASGMSALVTERVTRAEATQRAGRAGRVAPGTAWRLWTRGEEGGLQPFPPPEILAADLAPLALDLALWGSDDLPFLTPPPVGALNEARRLLTDLGALRDGRITPHGKEMAALAVHPRLAHMLLRAGKPAAPLAAILSEGERPPPGSADLSALLEGKLRPESRDRLRRETSRLARLAPDRPTMDPGAMAALAYPDRIALRRPGDAPRFLLSGGRGAIATPGDPLGAQRLLVVTDLDGAGEEARIRAALPVSDADLRSVLADRIVTVEEAAWSPRESRVQARRQERLGALVLSDRPWENAPPEAIARAMLDGARTLGLRPSDAAERFRSRVALARFAGGDLPDLSDVALMETLEDWLLPWLDGVRTETDWRRFDLLPPLRSMLTRAQQQEIDRLVPGHFTTPLGRSIPITYASDGPEIEVRLQEMLGVTAHPLAAGKPIRVTLLSPGHKPIAVVSDLPGFWRSSYPEVRKEMRGRYPRHPWPESPWEAEPTLRAKPRGT
ncbi:ATP-dependent helicase HrpB [Rubellimicrobium mesophilum DSM 19309]|uniref:ATP-dependent helicase HrpB n=1 Tax=Rubellimicrobium mesophilum DSM 19309 TaxID=442562 RepID=A0A017HTJ7_9RHOB|nr:ATP-dependent helicase HrpB [Rubellimicrobium mesophilum]EYD77650.1 ATP-dependent helicase HrpB [Rubellimicrobium mesophilum DSM 19309]